MRHLAGVAVGRGVDDVNYWTSVASSVEEVADRAKVAAL